MVFFLGQAVGSKQRKPNPNNIFFQNYSAHLDYIQEETKTILNTINSKESLNEALAVLAEEIGKRLYVFEGLRDGHDYTDEILGATVLPILGMVTSIATLALAAWSGMKDLAMRACFMENDANYHASQMLLLSGMAFIVAVSSFLKSVFSLFTRPIATGIKGWEPQDTDRFIYENSII